jgi:hypothetical protein
MSLIATVCTLIATDRSYPAAMPTVAKGHIEQLPSGSFRVYVYAGTDPLTRRQIQLKCTVKTEQQAHIELGSLKEAREGRTPESDATRTGPRTKSPRPPLRLG